MAMDTGARTTIVRPDLAEEIGIDLRDDPTSEVVGVGGTATVRKGVVDAVTVLGHPVRAVEVVCQDLHPALAFDGILGLDVLQHFNITIDNERVLLEPRG
jgi:hypothetical protein